MSIAYDVVTQSGVTKVTSQAVLRDLEEDDLEGSFTIHVTHGHLIRSLVHVLRDMVDYGIIELTPTKMKLLRVDKTARVIVSIDIDTSKFFQYLFVSRKGIIRIGISFAVLWQCVKVIGKQDPFIMSKTDGHEFVVLDFGNLAKQLYPLQGVCNQHIDVPTYQSKQPNVFITVKELTKAMSYLRTERGRAHLKGYKDRLVIETLNGKKFQRMGTSFDDTWRRIGLDPERILAMMKANPDLSCSLHLNEAGTAIAEFETAQNYEKYGTAGAEPTVDVIQSHLVLKSLSKVYTIAPNSGVLATVEADHPILLTIPIGDYGYLSLYLLINPWLSAGGEAATASVLLLDTPTSTPVDESDEEEVQDKPPTPVVKPKKSSRTKATIPPPAESEPVVVKHRPKRKAVQPVEE